MSELVNLTVRVPREMKEKAEQACRYYGDTITSVIRHALHDHYKRQLIEQENMSARARQAMEGEAAMFTVELARLGAYLLHKSGEADKYCANDSEAKMRFLKLLSEHRALNPGLYAEMQDSLTWRS